MQEFEHQEYMIKKLLFEMISIFSDIQHRQEYKTNKHDSEDDFELFYEIENLEDRFIDFSKRVYKLCITYFELKKLPLLINRFTEELDPILAKKAKTLEGFYDDYTGDVYSTINGIFWTYLQSFPAFGQIDNKALLNRTGITYLENILENTAVIIHDLKLEPTTETQVSNAVKPIIKAIFPDVNFPTQSFQKSAKCYIPDILIPTLNCAVEYKYATTEKKLIDTIDEILIDVKGYDKHPNYKIFYAVFYVKTGICTKNRFEVIWREKEFPENWKGIFVHAKTL